MNVKIIDMHCDTIAALLEKRRKGEEVCLKQNNGHIDLQRLQKSGYLLQNFALFVDMGACSDPWKQFCELHSLYEEELKQNEDILAPVLQFSDIEKNNAAGKISSLCTVEEGGVCQGELTKLHTLYEKGVRMLTLTWNYPNEIGYPNIDARDFSGFYIPNTKDGLTERGKEFVTEIEKIGMIPDVSHLSDKGFYDVLEITKKPFVASHSDARAVSPCTRNMTDDMIRALAERGGCMGLNFCADFLEELPVGTPKGTKNPGTIQAVVRHAKHILSVGGIEVLGLGSDFDGIDTHRELSGAEAMSKLWESLHSAGFTQSQLDKLFCENVLRVYRDTL